MTSDITNDWNGQYCTLKSILYTSPLYLDLPYRNLSPLFIGGSAQMGGSDQEKNESFDRAYDMLHTIFSAQHFTYVRPKYYVDHTYTICNEPTQHATSITYAAYIMSNIKLTRASSSGYNIVFHTRIQM